MSKILRSPRVPLTQRLTTARASLAWLVLVCTAAIGCKEECPPHTVQSGKLCVFKRDGGEAVAAVGGSGADLAGSGWSCSNVGLACVCRQDMTQGQGCSTLPPCCFTATDAEVNVCECWPSNSSECTSAQNGQRSGATIVASCPPR